jgi:hypothetical protein
MRTEDQIAIAHATSGCGQQQLLGVGAACRRAVIAVHCSYKHGQVLEVVGACTLSS